ncbi:hypothetical protein AMJ47_03350 [Parcubacteria bacterium DG_72]|nr:MAG: hypothetical protein AMJ47_03350 [Parcubacteria bacterium DG_72]
MKKILLVWFLVFLLLPVFASAQRTCPACTEPGGMVPCGRKCDDPSTPRDECLPCTLCDFFVMIDRMIDNIILKPLTPVLITLIIGIMVITAYARKGAPEIINKIKRALAGVVIGVIIIYAAWVIVYMVLLATGAVTWSGLNNLWIINCPSQVQPTPPTLVGTFCGDDNIQRPNNNDEVEICDGNALAGQTCRTRGFESGDLACLKDCSGFDESACVAYAQPPSPALPSPVPMNPKPLVPAPVMIRQAVCDFDGTWLYNDQDWGNDMAITCRGGIITGWCGEPCVRYRGLHPGVYCCETETVTNGVDCDFEGTWLYNDEGWGNDIAITCRGGIVTGWCGEPCVRYRGLHPGVYCCETALAVDKDCGPQLIGCDFEGTWLYNDEGWGNDMAITCRGGVVTGWCGEPCVRYRGLHPGVYCCES